MELNAALLKTMFDFMKQLFIDLISDNMEILVGLWENGTQYHRRFLNDFSLIDTFEDWRFAKSKGKKVKKHISFMD